GFLERDARCRPLVAVAFGPDRTKRDLSAGSEQSEALFIADLSSSPGTASVLALELDFFFDTAPLDGRFCSSNTSLSSAPRSNHEDSGGVLHCLRFKGRLLISYTICLAAV